MITSSTSGSRSVSSTTSESADIGCNDSTASLKNSRALVGSQFCAMLSRNCRQVSARPQQCCTLFFDHLDVAQRLHPFRPLFGAHLVHLRLQQFDAAGQNRQRVAQIVYDLVGMLPELRQGPGFGQFGAEVEIEFRQFAGDIHTGAFAPREHHIFRHGFEHRVRVGRLRHEVGGLVAESLAGGFQRAVAREHDDGDALVERANIEQTLQPSSPRHPIIENNRVKLIGPQKFQTVGDGTRHHHVVVVLEQDAQTFTRAVIIVDNENLRFSGRGRRLFDSGFEHGGHNGVGVIADPEIQRRTMGGAEVEFERFSNGGTETTERSSFYTRRPSGGGLSKLSHDFVPNTTLKKSKPMNQPRWQSADDTYDQRRRVVITGLGAVSAAGIGVPALWQALLEGRSGISHITLFDAGELSSRIAGEVKDFDPIKLIEPRLKPKRLARQAQFGLVAAKEAVADAGLDGTSLRARKCGVVMGSALYNVEEIAASARSVERRGAQYAHPTAIPLINMQAQAAIIVEMLEMENVPAFSVASACTSGMDAVALACDMIRSGQVDAMICGGADAPISRNPAAEIIQAGMCSTRNDEPERASRPFDRERDNGLLAEGAGVILLERLDYALDRGATPYAEILGEHSCRDPEGGGPGTGLVRTMRTAMQNGRCRETDVDYVSAWGCGDPKVDRIETASIKEVFGDRAYDIAIGSIKGVTGNPLAAAGALQLVAASLSLRHGLLPPTANYEHRDLDCDLDYIQAKPRRVRPTAHSY